MIHRLSLSQRLALVFTLLLLLCALAVCLIQLYSSAQYGNVMVQRLSAGLAQQIAAREPLLDAQGQVDRRMLKPLFDRLMTFARRRAAGRRRAARSYQTPAHRSGAGANVPFRRRVAGIRRRSAQP